MIRTLEKLMKFCSIMLVIGPYSLPGNVLLAPMAGVSDIPFRQICQSYGASLTTSEMLNARSELWNTRKSRLRVMATTGNRNIPHSVQIVGSEPERMATAARLAVDHGADIVDINMGCPAKKVCNKAAGSALLRDPQLVTDILAAVVNAVTVPVTLKIRTGWDTSHRNAVQIARIAEDSGIQMLAVHGRTRACRFNGLAEYDTIAEVKKAVSIPVVANGDITDAGKALEVLDCTGADGIMIGRGAQGSPWLFRQIMAAQQGATVTEPGLADKARCMIEHVSALHEFYGEHLGLRIARKHAGWYLDKMGLAVHRQRFNQLETAQTQLSFLQHLCQEQPEGIAA